MVEPIISMGDCIHGHLYRIQARNLTSGIYREDTRGFIGIREKFTERYLFTEYHFDIGPPHGTAHPKEDLGLCPITQLVEGQSRDGRWYQNNALFSWLDNQEDTI